MIFLLGGRGYVGRAYQRFFQQQGLACRSLSRTEVDYTNREVLTELLREQPPEFLINCAGYTGQPNVDACEQHKADCLLGNAVLPGLVRDACEAAGVAWGHISSGCIYNGSKPGGAGFTEEDEPNFTFRHNNCSFYSGSKALGEEVLAGARQCYLWRIRIPFDNLDHPRNYLTKLMRYERLLEARNSLSDLNECVAATWQCWSKRAPFGIYHVTQPGSVTTREVVELIKESGVCRKEFRFFTSEVEFMRLAAKTPRSNCVLDSGKLARAGLALTEIRDAIRRALRRWQQ
ncbi:MAG: sugar nucleotide-binding protein [Planctomycetes bacterium]|nr:sugar nucleotide-binding protein [Planctomycetota bacterium]